MWEEAGAEIMVGEEREEGPGAGCTTGSYALHVDLHCEGLHTGSLGQTTRRPRSLVLPSIQKQYLQCLGYTA
jgi:hypothetical protein